MIVPLRFVHCKSHSSTFKLLYLLFYFYLFQLELFCSVNILQFIFLALRLDNFISWSWEVVFVPLWILMCLSLVGVLYTIIFAGILLRAPEVNPQQRRTSFNSALGYTFLVIPILIFQVCNCFLKTN